MMNYQTKNIQKRFIAGASCPNCNDLDSLVLNTKDQSIECVSCDFSQTTQQRDQDNNKQSSSLEIGDIKITPVE